MPLSFAVPTSEAPNARSDWRRWRTPSGRSLEQQLTRDSGKSEIAGPCTTPSNAQLSATSSRTANNEFLRASGRIERPRSSAPIVDAAAPEGRLDHIEHGNAHQRLGGDWRVATLGDVETACAADAPSRRRLRCGRRAAFCRARSRRNARCPDRSRAVLAGVLRAWGVGVDNRRRAGAGARPIATRRCPEVPSLVLPRPGSRTGTGVSSTASLAEPSTT